MNGELDHLKDKFSEEIERFKEGLSEGRQENFEAYKYTCGVIRGLRYAVESVEYLQRRIEEGDDE
jgi:hypothetical protein